MAAASGGLILKSEAGVRGASILFATEAVRYPLGGRHALLHHTTDITFGNIGFAELAFVLLAWGLPLMLLVRFVRTLTAVAASLRGIAERLITLERTVRDAFTHRAS